MAKENAGRIIFFSIAYCALLSLAIFDFNGADKDL